MGEKRHHKPVGGLKRALVANIYAQLGIAPPPQESPPKPDGSGPGVQMLVNRGIPNGTAQRLLGASDVRLSTVEEAAAKLRVGSPDLLLRQPDGGSLVLVETKAPRPSLEESVRAAVEAFSKLSPAQWNMVVEGLRPVIGHPEMRDEVVDNVMPVLVVAASKWDIAA